MLFSEIEKAIVARTFHDAYKYTNSNIRINYGTFAEFKDLADEFKIMNDEKVCRLFTLLFGAIDIFLTFEFSTGGFAKDIIPRYCYILRRQ